MRELVIVTFAASTVTQPLMSRPLIVVPAVVITSDPLGLSVTPAGTPVLLAFGQTPVIAPRLVLVGVGEGVTGGFGVGETEWLGDGEACVGVGLGAALEDAAGACVCRVAVGGGVT